MSDSGRESFRYILRTIVIAVVTGVSAAIIVALFDFALDWLMGLLDSGNSPLRVVLPLIGALLVGTAILRRAPAAGGEGVQFYITAVNIRGGKFNLLATILRFPATVLTLGLIGSGGTVGPLARICAGAGSFIVDRAIGRSRLSREDDLSVGAICNVSGAISAIFHSPLAAGLYATEVLRRESIRYTDLVVALLSAVVAFVTSSIILGMEPYFIFYAPRMELSAIDTLWLPVTAVIAGLTGLLFILVFEHTTKLFHRIPYGQPAQAVAAGVILSLALVSGLNWSLRTSPELYAGLSAGEIDYIASVPLYTIHIVLPFTLIILTKILLTSVTIGSGMSAGFTGPLIIMGMTLGALVSSVTGTDPAGAAY